MTESTPKASDALRPSDERPGLAAQLEALGGLWWRWLAVDAALRALWLLRPDPFGQPLVGKVEWYLFHAIGFDAVQLLWLALPAALAVVVGRQAGRVQLGWRIGRAWSLAVGGLFCLLGLIDAEIMRFVGMHVSWSILRTYLNGAQVAELPHLLSRDAGGPYLPFALLTAIPGLLWWQWRTAPVPTVRWPRKALALLGVALAGWLLTSVLWQGAAREWKLTPPLTLLWQDLQRGARPDRPPEVVERAKKALRVGHAAGYPGSNATFAVPAAPLVHLSPWQRCQAIRDGQIADNPAAACARDRDGDGVPQARDCDDAQAAVHPGADEIPGDGIDQDCSGLDAAPYNVLVIALESHRALGVGHVTGGPSWSPRLDQLAAEGLAQRRAVTAGLPTIASFMAIHTGLPACAWCTVATDFATARLPALPLTLRQHGYYTRFFSAADPSWDNQAAWLRHWYHDVDYDRSREEDGPLFAHMASWLHTNLAGTAKNRPFFALVMTRTNHFPFARIAGVQNRGGDTWADGMRDTMHYADAEMGKLLDALRNEPWFDRTLVIVTGDHGHPLGEHGHLHLFDTVQVEATGVPLVVWGKHPKLGPLRGQIGSEPSSHLDIAPTVLDLLGIDLSGAWQGRSLLRGGKGQSWTAKDAMWAAERGSRRLFVDGSRHLDRAGWQVFDRTTDLREDKPLALTDADAELAADLMAVATWMYDLYGHDQILPKWWPTPQQ